jgi:hypothetical protein
MSFDKSSKTFRYIKTFRDLNFIQENDQPDLEIMRVQLDCINALMFIDVKPGVVLNMNGEELERYLNNLWRDIKCFNGDSNVVRIWKYLQYSSVKGCSYKETAIGSISR